SGTLPLPFTCHVSAFSLHSPRLHVLSFPLAYALSLSLSLSLLLVCLSSFRCFQSFECVLCHLCHLYTTFFVFPSRRTFQVCRQVSNKVLIKSVDSISVNWSEMIQNDARTDCASWWYLRPNWMVPLIGPLVLIKGSTPSHTGARSQESPDLGRQDQTSARGQCRF